MEYESPPPPLYFFILACVFLSSYFYNDDSEIFYDTHTGFSVLVGNMFIINEHNGQNCRFEDGANGSYSGKYMGLSLLI